MSWNGVIESFQYEPRVSVDSFNTLAVVKDWLEVEHTEHDTLITEIALAAEDYIFRVTGIAFKADVGQPIATLKLQSFPSKEYITFPVRYAISTSASLTYYDENNQSQDLTSTLTITYENLQDLSGKFLKVWKDPDETWPDVNTERRFPITITMRSGFTDGEETPGSLLIAMKLLIADWYENRENPARSIPTAADMILNKYRQINI